MGEEPIGDLGNNVRIESGVALPFVLVFETATGGEVSFDIRSTCRRPDAAPAGGPPG